MKKIITGASSLLVSILAIAQMDLPPEGGSTAATVSEDVGITSIMIKYHRPAVKGREGKIWGNLVPYGFNGFNMAVLKPASPWRAGANEATTISFEHDVKVEGNHLKAGSYALYMAVGKDSVTVIFSKEVEAWGTFYYRPENDVLRVYVKPIVLDRSVERLKYEFIHQLEKSCVVTMQWEKIMVPFRVDVDVDNIVLSRIQQQLKSSKGFISGNLLHLSHYYINKNTNPEEALRLAQKAVTGEPFGQSTYITISMLATAYETLNRMHQADSVMNIALLISTMSQHIAYGQQLLAQKRNERALEVTLGAQKK